MVVARKESPEAADQPRPLPRADTLAEAVALVAEALEAVALAEQRTTEAEALNDELVTHCSEQLRCALLRAHTQEKRAEFAERKAAILRDCLRTICDALEAAAD
jgi:hypothetical protein